MNPQDASTVWSLFMGVVATAASIIAWSARKHWSDLEKRIEQLEGGEKTVSQRIVDHHVTLAGIGPLKEALQDLKAEVRTMRQDLYRANITTTRPPFGSTHHE